MDYDQSIALNITI